MKSNDIKSVKVNVKQCFTKDLRFIDYIFIFEVKASCW